MNVQRIAFAGASALGAAVLFLWSFADRFAPGQDATHVGAAAFAAVFFGLLAISTRDRP
jgi:hypothetical protein